jgi:hypothetical protein
VPRIPFLTAACIVVLAGCSRQPDSYAPPEQRRPLPVSQPSFIGPFIDMVNAHADAYIVRDVSPATEGGSWRWTHARPELQFYVTGVENVKYAMDFAIAEATFKETGPVTLSVFVNGTPLHKQKYDKPGQYKMEIPVPPSMLKASALNRVAIEPDKVWVSKADGAKLGFILSAAGFRY